MDNDRTDAESSIDESELGGDLIAPMSSPSEAEAAVPAPRKFKRKLTTFLAQEMLYEFAIGTLDNERRMAVEEFVAGDRECQSILDSIRGSLSFTEKLAATELKPEVLMHLRESENVISLSRRYSNWSTWPDSMRWSIVAVGISLVVAGTVSMVPWQRITQTAQHKGPESVEVAKIPAESPEQIKTLAENAEADTSVDQGSGDEADVADAGSGDADEAGSGEAGTVSGLSPAQKAKQAQEERRQVKAEAAQRAADDEKARKAEVREQALAARSRPGHGDNGVDGGTWASGGVQAPIALSRKPMPLIAGLLDKLFVTPLGVLPQSHVAQATADDSTPESEAPVAMTDDKNPKKEPEVSAALAPPGKSLEKSATDLNTAQNSTRHSGGVESDAEAVAENSPATSAPLGGSASSSATTALTIAQIPETASKGGAKPKGFVYRAFMNLDDLDTLGPKVTQLIQELGGVKAGEVELGWKKGNSVRYYHFSMPEESQERLLEQLQTYGPVRITKDPHPRIMPKGQVRFILWVESSKSAH